MHALTTSPQLSTLNFRQASPLSKCRRIFNKIARRAKKYTTTSANSVELDCGSSSRVYFDNVTLTSHNVAMASQRPCQNNNKFNCSETNGYSIPQNAINEV